MNRVAKIIIKPADPYYKELDEFCLKSKNLYNQGLYRLREAYFEYDNIISYENLDKILKKQTKYRDYQNMPGAACAQQTLRRLCDTWKGFWNSVLEYKRNPDKFTGRPQMPKFLHKTKGRYNLILTNQQVKCNNGVITFPKSFNGFELHLEVIGTVQQIRFVPRNRHIIAEIVYCIPEKEPMPDNSRYISIDLGVDNFATIVSNIGVIPVVINGKGLKSKNKYWNKLNSHYKSITKKVNDRWTSKRIENLTYKRNNVVEDFMHKASRKVIEIALKNDISRIVVGKNDGWKSESKLSKSVNQSFVQIPHASFISKLLYKAQDVGITVIATEESYTSKTSFLDGESPIKQDKYKGKRRKRGLFVSEYGTLINADVGAYQIIKKVFPNAFSGRDIGCGLHPSVVNII